MTIDKTQALLFLLAFTLTVTFVLITNRALNVANKPVTNTPTETRLVTHDLPMDPAYGTVYVKPVIDGHEILVFRTGGGALFALHSPGCTNCSAGVESIQNIVSKTMEIMTK